MIGKWMETLPDEQLANLTDVPAENWLCNGFLSPSQPQMGCLLTHVLGARNAIYSVEGCAYCSAALIALSDKFTDVYRRYDAINNRRPESQLGRMARRDIVTMIQNRARRILASRKLANMPTTERAPTPDSPVSV